MGLISIFFELNTSKTAVKLYFEWLMSLQMNDRGCVKIRLQAQITKNAAITTNKIPRCSARASFSLKK